MLCCTHRVISDSSVLAVTTVVLGCRHNQEFEQYSAYIHQQEPRIKSDQQHPVCPVIHMQLVCRHNQELE